MGRRLRGMFIKLTLQRFLNCERINAELKKLFMLRSDKRKCLDADDYFTIVEDFKVLTQAILLLMTPLNKYKKDIFITYTLARNIVLLESIAQLWRHQHYNDCIILYRAQLDRLLHMYHLIDNDEIDVFDDWSFIKNFESRNNIRSEEQFKEYLISEFWNEPKYRVERYKRLKQAKVTWKRPDLSKVAKARDVDYLYKFGYDMASGYVHPLSSDGELEFNLLTGLEKNNKVDLDYSAIIHNSIATYLLILHEGLSAIRYKWRSDFFDYIDSVQALFNGKESNHREILYVILKMFESKEELVKE